MKIIDIAPGPAIPINTDIRITVTIHPNTGIILMDGVITINIIIDPNAGYGGKSGRTNDG
jgi:hypothetical protein